MSSAFVPRPLSYRAPKHQALVSKRIIACEGEDEYDILTLLCNQKQLTLEDVQLIILQRDNLEAGFRRLKAESNFGQITKLACVFDAEENPDQFKTYLSAALHEQDLTSMTVPTDCLLHPAAGKGSLERHIRSYLQANALLDLSCVNEWFACTQASNPAAYSTTAQWDKAWVQVWLAARMASTAYSRVGFAMGNNSGIADLLLPAFADLSVWLDTFVEKNHV
jgi:hypothetical protein